jgi:hypothetical protein
MADEAVARGDLANVFFGPVILKASLPVTARGKVDDIVAVLGLVIDDDGDTGRRAVLPPSIQPSLEVMTSEIPCINRHLHFIFKRPLPVAAAQKLAELLHRKCGGDHGTGDVAHVWRLPGTKNHPNQKKIDGRGRPVDPQSVVLTGGSMQRIDAEELRRPLTQCRTCTSPVRVATVMRAATAVDRLTEMRSSRGCRDTSSTSSKPR